VCSIGKAYIFKQQTSKKYCPIIAEAKPPNAKAMDQRDNQPMELTAAL
jgi:hypothetical protein